MTADTLFELDPQNPPERPGSRAVTQHGPGVPRRAEIGHTMRVTLDRDTVRLTPVCHEPAGAVCRVTCADEHGLKPVHCNAVTWLTEEDNAAECCSDIAEIPLYDGMPIHVFWEGDSYSWSTYPGSFSTVTGRDLFSTTESTGDRR